MQYCNPFDHKNRKRNYANAQKIAAINEILLCVMSCSICLWQEQFYFSINYNTTRSGIKRNMKNKRDKFVDAKIVIQYNQILNQCEFIVCSKLDHDLTWFTLEWLFVFRVIVTVVPVM